MPILTLDLAKAYLKVAANDATHDDLLTRFVNGLDAAVEDHKHEVIAARTITERLSLSGRCRFRLWRLPVISLDSLASVDGTRTYDVSPTVLDVEPDTGLVEVISGVAPTGRCIATYTAGYASVPENYVQGALVMLQHLWDTQRGAGQTVNARFGDPAVGPEEARDVRYMYTFPRKAREWFGPPRPVVG